MAKKEQEMYEGMPVIEASDRKALEKKLEQMESRPEKVVVRISSRAKKIKESAFPLVEFAGIQAGLQLLKIVQTNDIAIVLIPDSVTEIGRDAFRGCTGLTSIVIPDSVTEIGRDAFPENTEIIRK